MEPATQAFVTTDATWTGVVLLVTAGLFLAAATVGVISRVVAPEAYADMGPQDEPPVAEQEDKVQE